MNLRQYLSNEQSEEMTTYQQEEEQPLEEEQIQQQSFPLEEELEVEEQYEEQTFQFEEPFRQSVFQKPPTPPPRANHHHHQHQQLQHQQLQQQVETAQNHQNHYKKQISQESRDQVDNEQLDNDNHVDALEQARLKKLDFFRALGQATLDEIETTPNCDVKTSPMMILPSHIVNASDYNRQTSAPSSALSTSLPLTNCSRQMSVPASWREESRKRSQSIDRGKDCIICEFKFNCVIIVI